MVWLLDEVDRLYGGVVTEPEAWSDQRFVDWSEAVAAADGMDRATARHLRRILTTARKLRSFWATAEDRPDLGWRSRVDLALGPRAWRPVLDLASDLLEAEPSEELFERTAELFRVVNNQPYLDGIEYGQWVEDHTPGR